MADRDGSERVRASNKTAGDCPDFAESSEQNGTVPLSEAVLLDTPKSISISTPAGVKEDVVAVRRQKASVPAELRRVRPATKETGGGFNFTLHMRHLCADLTVRLPELSHIDIDRVAIRFCQARKAVRHGIHASLTPLRFERGEMFARRRGCTWTPERLYDESGRELLYLLSFYLPRFLERSFEEKLATVIHELWHVSPGFDGDLRRHPGRCYAHSHSQKQYDALMNELARKWLSHNPPSGTWEFLRYDFAQLERQHGRVFGQRISTPKLIRAS